MRHIGTGLALLALFVAIRPAAAQTAALVGTVKDPTQGLVPQANVTLTNLATGVNVGTVTDNAGNYEFAVVRPGNYSLKVDHPGFKAYVQSPINLLVGERARADVNLEVGVATEMVTVSEGASGVQTESSSMGQVIDIKKVLDMPLNGRFFLDLAMLAPGTVLPSTNNRNFLAVPTSGGPLGLNSSGAREDQINYLFDGVNLSDMTQNQLTLLPNVEVVQEFKVQNNTFSAEYGRNAGIIINAVTKSGTNGIHGSAFEFLRNDKLDARNFFDVKLPPFKRNIYGESIGGPVVLPGYDGRNRTFFFESFEGRRQRESDTFRTTVPSDAQRAAVTNPVVKKLLALVPAPNVGGDVNNFGGSASKNRDLDQVTGKVDHMIGQQNILSGTYIFQRDRRLEPTSTGAHSLPGYGDFRPARRQLLALHYTRIISPRVTNEFHAGFNRVHINFLESYQANPQDFGMSIGATDNFPDFRVAGGPSFGGITGFPQGRADTTFQYTDTVAWVRGAHSLKLGGEIRRFWNNVLSDNEGGRIDFPSISAFLAGQPNRTQVTHGKVTPALRVTAYNGFFEDDYKVTPRLTLNLGVRYEYNGVPGDTRNRLAIFDFGTAQVVQIGTNGIQSVYKKEFHDFGPRAGFSFDPFGHGTTVVRGGYGIYFDQPVTNLVSALASNPPFAVPLTITTPGIDLANPYAFTGTVTPSPAVVAPNFVPAYVEQYNLNIQHEAWRTVFQAGYIGSAGRHLRIRRDGNQGIKGVRPYASFSQFVMQESSSTSNYNALWISADRRLAQGLTFTTSYTFSKSIDLNSVSSSDAQVQNSYNLAAERALSDFDARQRFVLSTIYELPIKVEGPLKKVVGGWSLAGILNLQTGNPFSPIVPTLRSGSNDLYDRPDVAPGQALYPSHQSPNLWMNPAAFTLNAANTFGNAGRNILTAPPFKNLDLALLKNTTIHERFGVQFRAEFFDIANHANFGQPSNSVGNPTFGVISFTRLARGDLGSSRQIEFGLKILF